MNWLILHLQWIGGIIVGLATLAAVAYIMGRWLWPPDDPWGDDDQRTFEQVICSHCPKINTPECPFKIKK